MNATLAPASPNDRANPHPYGAWWDILRLAGRLVAEHWPALLFWWFLQRVLYNVSMDIAVALTDRSLLLAYAAIALLVVGQLATGIGMFLCLRPSLPVLSARDVPAADAAPGRSWVRALAVALLPFFAYYTTWGLLDTLRRDFQLHYTLHLFSPDAPSPTDILHVHWLWLALTASYLIRRVALARTKSTDRIGWTLLATACEAYWVFVGARAITQGIGMAKHWWYDRLAYRVLSAWWDDPRALFHLLQPTRSLFSPLADFVATAFNGVVTPMVWLAITAIIYGMDMRRSNRIDAADARLGQLGARYSAMPLLVRKLAGKASKGWTSKGVPIVNSLRLTLRAGLPALLVLCLGFQILELVDAWAWRGVALAFADTQRDLWQRFEPVTAALLGSPIGLRPALFTEMLRIALLAATCDYAIGRIRSGSDESAAAQSDALTASRAAAR